MPSSISLTIPLKSEEARQIKIKPYPFIELPYLHGQSHKPNRSLPLIQPSRPKIKGVLQKMEAKKHHSPPQSQKAKSLDKIQEEVNEQCKLLQRVNARNLDKPRHERLTPFGSIKGGDEKTEKKGGFLGRHHHKERILEAAEKKQREEKVSIFKSWVG